MYVHPYRQILNRTNQLMTERRFLVPYVQQRVFKFGIMIAYLQKELN